MHFSFAEIYNNRPDQNEVGSSGYSNMKNLYDLCNELQPTLIVESGTWKGNSSWLFSHFAEVVCHDIQFDTLLWKAEWIKYIQDDIAGYSYPAHTLFYFDDHISQLDRLEWLIASGYHQAIFDDNQPGHIASTLKNPATPTLEELLEQGHPIMDKIKHYEVMPFRGNKRNFDNRLTYIEI